MERLLKPWLLRADTLVPQWRICWRTNRPIQIPTNNVENHRVWETLAVLVCVYSIDASSLVALVDGTSAHLETLRVAVQIDPSRANMWAFHDTKAETKSPAYHETMKKLYGNEKPKVLGVDVEVTIRVERSFVCARHRLDLHSIVNVLNHSDSCIFQIKTIHIDLATAYIEPSSLLALGYAVERFKNTADVRIRLDLAQPRDQDVGLADWKRVFDFTIRRQTDSNERSQRWDLDVVMSGGQDLVTGQSSSMHTDAIDARVVAACFSALAHAGKHVTSVNLVHPLEDPDQQDYYKPTERRLRAKWLGYLLRVGGIESVTIQERTLTHDDMDAIASTLHARTMHDCLRTLWHEAWHEQKIKDLHSVLSCDDAEFSPVIDTARLDKETRDIIGVMQGFNQRGPLVDALIVGYGQCTIPRASFPMSQVIQEPSNDSSRLKSLKLQLSEGDGTEGHLLRMVMMAGKDLEELSIDAEHSQIALSVLIIILASCPKLKRLSISTIYLTTGDDEQLFLPTHWANHPLEDLSVDLHLNDASIGLSGLATMLVLFGVQLRTLRIRAEPSTATNYSARVSIQTMLSSCCSSLRSLEVIGLSWEYFQGILRPDALGLTQLGTLVLTDTASDPSVWQTTMKTLASPQYPLTQSLHTLHIDIHTVPVLAELVAQMLKTNDTLVRCYLTSSTHKLAIDELRATHGRSLRRRRAPLSLRQKAAFLSVAQQSDLPWESTVLGNILLLAAPTETRHVVVSRS